MQHSPARIGLLDERAFTCHRVAEIDPFPEHEIVAGTETVSGSAAPGDAMIGADESRSAVSATPDPKITPPMHATPPARIQRTTKKGISLDALISATSSYRND